MLMQTCKQITIETYPELFTREEKVVALANKKFRAHLEEDPLDHLKLTPRYDEFIDAIMQGDATKIHGMVLAAWKNYPHFLAEAERDIDND